MNDEEQRRHDELMAQLRRNNAPRPTDTLARMAIGGVVGLTVAAFVTPVVLAAGAVLTLGLGGLTAPHVEDDVPPAGTQGFEFNATPTPQVPYEQEWRGELASEANYFNAADAAFLRDLHVAWGQDREDANRPISSVVGSLFGVPDGQRYVAAAQVVCAQADPLTEAVEAVDPRPQGKLVDEVPLGVIVFRSPEAWTAARELVTVAVAHYCPERAS